MPTIRLATHKDIPAIHSIEKDSFSSPWAKHFFSDALNAATTIATAACDKNDTIVGYVFGRVAADEAEIVNLAVSPEKRGAGIGKALVKDFLHRAYAAGGRTAFLEVRTSNRAAQTLYNSIGFRQVYVRKRYYEDTGEDALIMSLQLIPNHSRTKQQYAPSPPLFLSEPGEDKDALGRW